MELHEMRYFLALSRMLNFTRAAEACHVSQPALTRAIRKMEDELGGLLFSRERNNTHMTDLGRLIEPHLADVVAKAGEVKQTAKRFLKVEKANLALGVMCTIAPVQFVSFLGRFRADNPGVEVALLKPFLTSFASCCRKATWMLRSWLGRTAFRQGFMLLSFTRKDLSSLAPRATGLPQRVRSPWSTLMGSSTCRGSTASFTTF